MLNRQYLAGIGDGGEEVARRFLEGAAHAQPAVPRRDRRWRRGGRAMVLRRGCPCSTGSTSKGPAVAARRSRDGFSKGLLMLNRQYLAGIGGGGEEVARRFLEGAAHAQPAVPRR